MKMKVKMKMIMIMTMLMILSSIVIEVIRTAFIFFYERYFKCEKHKQKHLSDIQPNISKQKKSK